MGIIGSSSQAVCQDGTSPLNAKDGLWKVMMALNLALLAICAIFLTGRNNESAFAAKSHLLSGPEGQVLAELSLTETGQPQFIMNSAAGHGSIHLKFDDAGSPRIGLFGKGNVPLLELGLHLGKSPVLIMRDEAFRRRFALIGTSEAGISMGFYDPNGTDRIKLATDERGHPWLAFKSQDDVLRASFGAFDDESVGIDLFDPIGKARLVFQVDANGLADAVLLDTNGSPEWSARTD